MKKRLLVAGPDWVMEFGWMLMRWQGYIRRISEMYDQTVVISKSGWFPVYSDFAVHEPTIGFASCSALKNIEVVYERPRKEICDGDVAQKFVKYGKIKPGLRYDVVVHARMIDIPNQMGNRNWPVAKWNELCSVLKSNGMTIASIGAGSAAYCPPGVDDYRGEHLSRVMNLLASSKLCIGPSSGPMHLASLCCCPHVVWTEPGARWCLGPINGSNRDRYETAWNPHRTRAIVVDQQGWQPSVELVYKHVKNELASEKPRTMPI